MAYLNEALTVTGTLAATGAATVGTTLGVTGAVTASSTLAVTGATTVAAITASGNLTANGSANAIKGVTAGTAVAAGIIGETVTQNRVRSANVSLTNNTAANVLATPVSLTAGEWLISGSVNFATANPTAVTDLEISVSTTSATLSALDTIGVPSSTGNYRAVRGVTTTFAGLDYTMPIPAYRLSLSGSTTLYLIAFGLFSSGVLAASGQLQATRIC